MPVTLCALCGAEEATPFHEEDGHAYVRCARCGLVYLRPIPTVEQLTEIYRREAGATFHHDAEIAGAEEKRLEARWRWSLVRDQLESVTPRGFEIGCGAGWFLELLASAGWSAAGCELAPAYVAFARSRGLDVREGDLRSAPAGPFGAVFLFNVLSHLRNPVNDLERVRDLLGPGGAVVIETGNAAEVEPRRVGHFGAPEHVYHFGERHLRGMLDRLGFDRLRVLRFNVEWQRRILGWRRPRAAGGGGGAGPPSKGRGLLRALASRFLLALRYEGGRVLADADHFCTLIVTARKR